MADPVGKVSGDVGNQAANNYQWNDIGEMTKDAEPDGLWDDTKPNVE